MSPYKNKIMRIISKVMKNQVIVGSGIVSIGIFLGSVISYLLQVFLGRFLSVEDYGTFNALLSLANILIVPSAAFSASVIKIVSDLKVKDKFDLLTNLFWQLTRYSILLGGVFLVSILLLSDQIADYLNISNSEIILPFSLYIGLAFLNITPRSYLQGLLRFRGFAFYVVLSSFLRLIFPMMLVIAGYKVGGVYVGISLAMIASFSVALLLLKKNFHEYTSQKLDRYFKSLLAFSVSVLFVKIASSLLTSVDLILVKHFFDQTTSGLYAGLTTVGKILLFGTGIIGSVMFPVISNLYSKQANYFKMFLLFLTAQIITVVLGVLVLSLYPALITSLMFGKAYLNVTSYLPRYAFFIGLYSMVNFLTLYSLAIEKTKIYILLMVGSVIQFLLINIYHTSLDIIININIAVLTVILLFVCVYLFIMIKKDVKGIYNSTYL